MMFEMKTGEAFLKYPEVRRCFEAYNLPVIDEEMSLRETVDSITGRWLRDMGITREVLENAIRAACRKKDEVEEREALWIENITILGGHDKSGKAESVAVTLKRGEIVCICGATGAGKTRLLEDIEYIAQGDSPTGRKMQINGIFPSEEERLLLENHLCASLSQTMNFVLELSCEEFIRLHARCRGKKLTESDDASLCREVMECANSLAGERFSKDTVITQLSGGQSRALMIADIACISDSPVVLIDEPENAGIDRDDILKLLSDRGKIVLVSTHDPLIALSCSRRIIIKNGGIAEILDRTQQEKMLLNTLRERDRVLKAVRECIRSGRQVLKEDCYGI
jgi:ABC-type lipoprotein export system ATPase subunit